ncbi:methionine--tRNA ligase [candidate division WWE3 bacterium]|jgi:methionine--tRNA ligase beta chain|uniref:Methionine--tRNA ligase n=1 Tax=candidate division WWE3 bacterium TaxID=2053526 RepID=A0A3A4ZCH1_UNCKA|nr:MAG: methionine--tRNA ligase [candidate division WWE3 bacterium]
MIKFDDFAKVDIRAGKVLICEKVEKSNKLLRMVVDFGELGEKQILTGLGEFIQPEEISGITALFVVNLEPRKLMGFESEGMIMGTDDETPKIVQAPQGTLPGTRVI